MVAYLDKMVGRLMRSLDDLDIADRTVVMFLADNGTDRDLRNGWGDGKSLRGGKGTMTDRGTRVPLIVRWPGHVAAGSTCGDLVDFSDFLPTLCDIAGAPPPGEEIHGRSFLPQLIGKPATARRWVHVQHKNDRHVRSADYILNNKSELRPVVELWEEPAEPNQNKDPEKEAAARKFLQSVFDELGDPRRIAP